MIRFIYIYLVSVLILAATVSCNTRQKSTEAVKTNDTLVLLKLGDSITTQVQKVLLANVMQAMKEGGPVNAVSFCNVHAMPLTDSLAEEYNCLIQRVSDKYRNPANIPTVTDLEILSGMSTANAMKPLIVSEDGHTVYYKPIKIGMPACLKCHGSKEKDIDSKTLEIIRQKYPEDLATDYKEGDLRGLWKITFLGD
jgi:hypothetical protein